MNFDCAAAYSFMSDKAILLDITRNRKARRFSHNIVVKSAAGRYGLWPDLCPARAPARPSHVTPGAGLGHRPLPGNPRRCGVFVRRGAGASASCAQQGRRAPGVAAGAAPVARRGGLRRLIRAYREGAGTARCGAVPDPVRINLTQVPSGGTTQPIIKADSTLKSY